MVGNRGGLPTIRNNRFSRASADRASASATHAQSRRMGRRALAGSGLSPGFSMGSRSALLGGLRRGFEPAVRTAGCATDSGRGPVIMSPPMRITAHLGVVMVLATAGSLAGCGHSAHDAGAAHAMHSGKSDATSAKPGNGIDPDMVNAVSAAGASTTLISMKFKLGARPFVTAPLQLTVLVIPSPAVTINHIHVSF